MTVADGAADDAVVLGMGTRQLAVAAAVGAVAVLVVVGAVAGAAVFLLGDDREADLGLVPGGADSVVFVNVDQATSDDQIRAVVDTYLELTPEEPDTMEDALADFENETGLDPDGLHQVTAFSRYDEDTGSGATEYSASILRTSWEEDDVVSAVEDDDGVSLRETSYRGVTVYEPENGELGTSSYLAVLGEETYVVGTQEAVEDVVDRDEGEGEAFEGELRDAFEDSRTGYVQFAFRFPEEQVPTEGQQLDTEKLRAISIVTGSYYVEADRLGVETTLYATGESEAQDVEDVMGGALALVRGTTTNDELKTELRNVEVTRDGTVVTINYENSVESIQDLLRALDEAGDEDARLGALAAGPEEVPGIWADATATSGAETAATTGADLATTADAPTTDATGAGGP